MGKYTSRNFIKELDGCFTTNDLEGAYDCVCRWERLAQEEKDENLLLTVYNELLGLSRRLQRKDAGMKAVDEVVRLIDKKQSLLWKDKGAGSVTDNNGSYIPTMLTNAATTCYAFGEQERSLGLFNRAEASFCEYGQENSYEYTSFLNNRAGVLCQLERYDEAEADYRLAVERLKEAGGHEGEIAVSLISLAHLIFDRGYVQDAGSVKKKHGEADSVQGLTMEDNSSQKRIMYQTIEGLLDEAWEWINKEGLAHDERYAFVLTKLAPSYEYFKRPIHGKALRETADEIYGERRLK